MVVTNEHLQLQIRDGRFTVHRLETGEELEFAWPAVTVGLRGKPVRPEAKLGKKTRASASLVIKHGHGFACFFT